MNEVCLRAKKKVSVLRHVKMLQRNTLDMLYKIKVRSVIDYVLDSSKCINPILHGGGGGKMQVHNFCA